LSPLEVAFHLRTPIALGYPWIFLDSLLAHVKLREALGERYYSLPTKVLARDELAELDLPLKAWRGVPVASVSIFEPRVELS